MSELYGEFERCGECEACCPTEPGEQVGWTIAGSCEARFFHVLAIAATGDRDEPWLPPSVPSGFWRDYFARWDTLPWVDGTRSPIVLLNGRDMARLGLEPAESKP